MTVGDRWHEETLRLLGKQFTLMETFRLSPHYATNGSLDTDVSNEFQMQIDKHLIGCTRAKSWTLHRGDRLAIAMGLDADGHFWQVFSNEKEMIETVETILILENCLNTSTA